MLLNFFSSLIIFEILTLKYLTSCVVLNDNWKDSLLYNQNYFIEN